MRLNELAFSVKVDRDYRAAAAVILFRDYLTGGHAGALAEKAEHVQQDDDEDRYACEPQDEIAKHGLHFLQVIQVRGRSWRPNANLAGTALSRCSPPLMAAHHAAANETSSEIAVTKSVRMAARRPLSAASRAALRASSTRLAASSWGCRPVAR